MPSYKLAVIIGGKSPEHKISLRSGKSVIAALDKSKYELYVIGIDMQGCWFLCDPENYLRHADDNQKMALAPGSVPVFLDTDGRKAFLVSKVTGKKITQLDVAFPVLHGAYGEDGVIQGLFRANNLAFVGVDLLTSSVGMDKDIAKRLWRDAGIPVADFLVVEKHEAGRITYAQATKQLGTPLFVKPANAGSSVGVHKVMSEQDFTKALEDGFQYDRKLLIETAITGIEVECAILGNERPKASVIGAIQPTDAFYSYDAKYVSTTGATLMIPAPIPPRISKKIQQMAIKAFRCIGGEGLSRVDFFLTPQNDIIINEINTLPGFTSISMYPKLWEASGLAYPKLLDTLIQLGIKRHRTLQRLKTTW